MRPTSFAIYLVLVAAFSPVSSTAFGFEITSTSEAKLKGISSTNVYQLSPGKPAKISVDETLWFESEGRIPVLIIPIAAKANSVTIDAPQSTQVVQSLAEVEVNQLLAEVMAEVSSIQNSMRKKQLSDSRSKLSSLMSRYPKVTFLKFLLASQQLLEGERQQALRTAEEAHKALPNYAEGKAFIQSLKEGSR